MTIMIHFTNFIKLKLMAPNTETILLLVALFFPFLFLLLWLKAQTPMQSPKLSSWPVLGMLPGLLHVGDRMLENTTDILQDTGGTFCFQGPCFANFDTLVTCDPANINYILCKNFSNYPKGPDFNKIFEMLGDGIFNAESETWELQRKTTMSLVNHTKFTKFLERILWSKVQQGLLPILDHVSQLGQEIDLQEVVLKFYHDISCKLMLGFDPCSLSVDSLHVQSEKAFVVAEEVALYRHILPISFWKFQRWLNIGLENKLQRATDILDHLVVHSISLKREELKTSRTNPTSSKNDDDQDFDLLTSFMDLYKNASNNSNKFLRDAILSLLFAARDTTSASLTWFFYMIATNPRVEIKIRDEMKAHLDVEGDKGLVGTKLDCIKKLVYLHAALCESLRLFPAVPLQHRASVQDDILPSGHIVPKNRKVILSFYSVGRMESVWGKDCLEYKPERWISDQGGIKHVPSYKFVAFNAGPRSCIGKEMSLSQMKIVAASIIYHYHMEVVEGHVVTPSKSIVLHMKHGLKVRVRKV